MSRLKLLAAAMLLALPIISACGDDVPPPPPTGSIDGLVSIEGQGQDGISVTLSNGATVTTTNGGMFRFDGVEAGAYTVTISNYPDDASFNQTSAAATIATDGENVTVNFPGTWIRTSAIMGTVTVENEGLGGVTVKLSGMSDSETITDGNGQFAFSGLRAGNYTVQISGFDDEDVAFGSTSSAAMVSVGESKVVTFEGTYLRASAITGQVTVEDNPLEGVMVSLQGKGE
ncbi:MAG: carboxypeptidase regulatory-like domain-containing protein, partial [Gemmatimonadetes bacterium]|nr:carboxypeptidase regulatory-like domain-containing protein [Gemmatimonadota bacterium]